MSTWLKVMIISLGCLAFSHQASAKEQLNTLIQNARKAKNNGKYLKAAKLLFKAYQLNKNPILLNNIGKMYEEAGYYREAYDAYRNVADDPNAPNDLRPMNISRMTAMESKLTKAHLRVKNADDIEVLQIEDEQITRDTFTIERSLPSGKRAFFFSPKESTNLFMNWLNLKAGRRTVVNITKTRKKATSKLVAFKLRGLETLRINGTALPHEDLNAIYLVPGVHLVSLNFNDGSEYERTFRMKAKSTYSCDDFATTFSQVTAPVERQSDTYLWLKGGAVALGVGLTTAGGLMAYDAKSTHDQILDDQQISMVDARDRWDSAQERGDRGVSIMGVGLTALTSGILWLALDAGTSDGRGAWDWLPRPFTMPNYALDQPPTGTAEVRSAP